MIESAAIVGLLVALWAVSLWVSYCFGFSDGKHIGWTEERAAWVAKRRAREEQS